MVSFIPFTDPEFAEMIFSNTLRSGAMKSPAPPYAAPVTKVVTKSFIPPYAAPVSKAVTKSCVGPNEPDESNALPLTSGNIFCIFIFNFR